MIKATNLTYQIPYSKTILENLDFEVKENELVGILGHNGAGKTTLMDLLMGFRKVTSGSLEVLGEDPHSLKRNRKSEIVFLSQDVMIKGNVTIADFLKFQSILYPLYNKQDEEHYLNVFKLSSDTKVATLSLGQQRKVQIVSGLSSRPRLIFIDEITAVLDPETREVFFSELKRYQEKYAATVVLATNIAEDLIGRADRTLFIRDQLSSIHQPEEILGLFNIEKVA
jgi:ABC-2 type transport system ATP-binding protein